MRIEDDAVGVGVYMLVDFELCDVCESKCV